VDVASPFPFALTERRARWSGAAIHSRRSLPATTTARQSVSSPEFVTLCALIAVLNVIGLVMILSASSVVALTSYGSSWYFFERQLAWTAAAAVVFVVTARRPYRVWVRGAKGLLGFSVLLLIAVLVPHVGILVAGSRRWLGFGPIRFQPAEIAKVGLLLAGAERLARKADRLRNWRSWRPVLVWMVGLSGLVMLEPDLGSTLMLLLLGIGLLVVAGVPRRALGALIGLTLTATTAVALMEPYRRARLLTFLHPSGDPLKKGYQLRESLVALGHGGLAGVGLGAGQAKWLYLPNPHTDFIFAVIGEETGLIGALSLIGLFVGLAALGFRIAQRAPDRVGQLLAAGVTIWITGQAIINIGAVIGVLPVTGIPLPFISFGGSSLLVTMFAAGILANIANQPKRKARPNLAGVRARDFFSAAGDARV
jgi:cell division protein FtsW